MPALVSRHPRLHFIVTKDVDGRKKSGHDERPRELPMTASPPTFPPATNLVVRAAPHVARTLPFSPKAHSSALRSHFPKSAAAA